MEIKIINENKYRFMDLLLLGAYCVSATSSHYDWAIKKVKMHIKTCNK